MSEAVFQLTTTATSSFAVCMTSIAALIIFKHAKKAVVFKDVLMFFVFAILDPYSEDITTFTVHALLAVIVYLVTLQAFLSFYAENRTADHEHDSSSGSEHAWR